MLEVNPYAIGKAIAETRQLLHEQRCTVEATTLRFTTAQALTGYLAGGAAATPQPHLPEALSHPSLTGMSRRELKALIQRLSLPQAARVERLRYQRRGARDRLPGTRGGIIPVRCRPKRDGQFYDEIITDLENSDDYGPIVTPRLREAVVVPESFKQREPLPLYVPTEPVTQDNKAVLEWLDSMG